MKRSDELLQQIRKANRQGLPATNFFCVVKEYWPLGQYMLKKFGWKSWYSFWTTKLFVPDEGGEYAIKDYLIYKFFPSLLRKPIQLEMEHTTICNKQCIFCEHTHWQEKPTRITFGFLNKDFMPMLAYLRKRDVNVNFVDEFDFFDEEISKKVIELGINSIYVSFDAATKETYETIKKGCNFDKALHNIRTLLRLKQEMNSPFPVLHFRFIVTLLNYQEMPEYIELMASLKNRGVRARVDFAGLLTFPGIEQYFMPLDAIPEHILVKTYENAIKHDINLHFSHASTALRSINNCTAWTEPYVLIGGEVISCCAIIMSNNRKYLRDNSFGNVYERSLMDIWQSQKYRNFRKQVNSKKAKVPKTCYGCRAFDTEQRAKACGVMDAEA
jgi:MoaA/NifB/PqqE/SkfB family radical SAM enzyme